MKLPRRKFLHLAAGAAAAWPVSARGQQPALPVIGALGAGSPAPFTDAAFREGLKEGGYVDGQNVRIEYRWARGEYERLPDLATELVNLPVTVMAAFGAPAARAVKSASTKVIPAISVVFSLGSDPVAEGLAASLNRPGGHMTGITSIAGALAPKRLELVREFLRGNAVAILINPTNPVSQAEQRDAEAASRAIGQRLEVLTASNEREIEASFTALKQQKVGALIIAVDTFFYTRIRQLAMLASRHGVPAIGPLREFAADGGLMSYGTSIFEVNRQVGIYVAKVLKGARPADLPILQPTKFELVLNLKAAKVLALEISPKLLALADEVIE